MRAAASKKSRAGSPISQHPPFPRPPNRAPCVPAAQTDGSIPIHQCRPLSPSGCPRIRLRIPPSLPWRNNSGPAGRADLECRCMISHAASRSCRSARETPSDRSMRGYRHRSDGKATALRSCPSCSIRGCHAFGTSCVFEAVQVAPTPRIRPRELQRYGGSEARGASQSRASNLKAGIGRILVGLLCAQKVLSTSGIFAKVHARPDART